ANHPNYGWAIRPHEIADTPGLRFFEVFNGHPGVHNRGDATHPSTDKMWDLALARRFEKGNKEPLYGLAVDDSHKYHSPRGVGAQPGRGWVMVRNRKRSEHLLPDTLIRALERGDFYSSSGVTLTDVRWNGRRLSLTIEPKPETEYTTRFIGTRHGAGPSEIGVVLAEVTGTAPSYTVSGDERYVRAKVISSRVRPDILQGKRHESAWTQPIFLKPR
ncbi:MAG: histidinol-phosphatase, partial [Armatimonadota bacterium]